ETMGALKAGVHDDPVARLEAGDAGADGFHRADDLVSEIDALVAWQGRRPDGWVHADKQQRQVRGAQPALMVADLQPAVAWRVGLRQVGNRCRAQRAPAYARPGATQRLHQEHLGDDLIYIYRAHDCSDVPSVVTRLYRLAFLHHRQDQI